LGSSAPDRLLRQPGLADSGLARDEHHPARSQAGIATRRVERHQLALTADHRASRDVHHASMMVDLPRRARRPRATVASPDPACQDCREERAMPKAIMFVQSSPSAPDREDEYNDWYTNTHLTDVLQIPGITAARRFKATEITPVQDGDHRYCAVYEVE